MNTHDKIKEIQADKVRKIKAQQAKAVAALSKLGFKAKVEINGADS